ncbi:MAG TPA: class I SAM-dependent rRNA methyltransferase, partial [Rhabdochlamydiaceae bacterium]|nr:class I SAM-dependent rRNA methyltransferase [Rhabdochlamydiaceae bacterium]
VDSIEACKNSCALAEKNLAPFPNQRVINEDVFDFITHNPLNYDLIILDPPAFAKKRKDIHDACQGYVRLNQTVFKKMAPRSYLLTCSCSQHIDESLFKNLIFQAAMHAGRRVKILSSHRQALDHPVSLAHPEGAYLKSLFLYIE